PHPPKEQRGLASAELLARPADAVGAAAIAAAGAATTPALSAGKIVVVDDDPASRELIARFLQAEGYTAITAATGEEGLRVARDVRPHHCSRRLAADAGREWPRGDRSARQRHAKADAHPAGPDDADDGRIRGHRRAEEKRPVAKHSGCRRHRQGPDAGGSRAA